MRFPEHSRGTAATVVFHGLLLMFLLGAGFRTELPLPGEQGIPIDLGTDDAGETPVEPEPVPAEASEPAVMPQPEQETTLTQDYEEAPVLAPPPAARTQERKTTPTDKRTVTTPDKAKKTVETEKPREREVNQQALFTGNNVRTAPAGRTAAEPEDKSGSPTGTQGAATGNGGIGNSFDLAGRSLSSPLPRPAYIGQNEGVVVVNITVDKDGNVIQAKFSLAGSTTNDEQLVAAAVKAAGQTHFNRKPDQPVQAGKITYTFKLQD